MSDKLTFTIEILFLLFFLLGYLYIAIWKNSRVMYAFLLVCILWSSSVIWTSFFPDPHGIFIEGSGNNVFPGYIVTLGGIVYGLPLTFLALGSFLFKRWKERRLVKTERTEDLRQQAK
jgi:hypothetical protein